MVYYNKYEESKRNVAFMDLTFEYRDREDEKKLRKQDRKASRRGRDKDERDDRSEKSARSGRSGRSSRGSPREKERKSKFEELKDEIARKVRKCKLLTNLLPIKFSSPINYHPTYKMDKNFDPLNFKFKF